MIEEWKPIPGYESSYEASNLGNIRSIERRVRTKGEALRIAYPRVLKPRKKSNGYLQVHLGDDGKRKYIGVHRLVAMAFLGVPKNKLEVNHIDGDKENNRLTNLEWVSTSKNKAHNYRVLGYENHGGDRAKKRIRCVETGEEYESINEAARQKGIFRQAICQAVKVPTHTAAGVHWEVVA